MGDVNYINSLGLGALMVARTTMINANGEIRLAQVGKKPQLLFQTVGLIKFFNIYETVDRAIGSFKSREK
jgi:anti-sigma B factor antagonist